MPKKGQRQPWRVTFQYGTQGKPSAVPHFSKHDAERFADGLLDVARSREYDVVITISNRDTAESYTYTGEIMASEDTQTRNDVSTDEGKAVVEQIDANIERARSLRDADALNDLEAETESLISSLSGKGSINVKKLKRDAWNDAEGEASDAMTAEAEAAGKAGAEVATLTYESFKGVPELVIVGAEKVTEGVSRDMSQAATAREVADVILDMWRRIPDADGNPDIDGKSGPAKEAARAVYRTAGEALGNLYSKDQGFDVAEAVKSFQRAVQHQRRDVRAKYLRSLDGDSEESIQERKRYESILQTKPDDKSPAAWVAEHYGLSLRGPLELRRERYQAERAAIEAGQPKPEPQPDDTPQLPPVERARAVVKVMKRDVTRTKPEEFDALTQAEKDELKPEVEAMFNAAKAIMTKFL
ncbi:hypothetical protein PV729_04280 [Streptomyces europaeiscabiei]|uniref:Uncharacterized protein n=1 Tax=Streptomyces europaeiscabiei TaxID=146819 RepID=A0ABU4N6Q4_9ACTN|nr:hypothetical protein [Streptomyces europaeiscabiei]MDX3550995.1 hypothetical protein [Streptomyces europaeiscabiei]MDX3698445.1 hypothetical protein [Streptomyces europaeiscabiei]